MRRLLYVTALVLMFGLGTLGQTLIYEANFDETDSPRIWWNFATGAWNLGGGKLVNLDGGSTNTNAYSEVEQDADLLIYEWKVTYDSKGNQWAPAAGLHILVANFGTANRSPSYLIFQDVGEVRTYRSIGEGLSQVRSVYAPAKQGETYTYKVTYSRLDGELSVYRDGELLYTWIDRAPLQWGEYISLRTNGTMATFHYVKVWAQD